MNDSTAAPVMCQNCLREPAYGNAILDIGYSPLLCTRCLSAYLLERDNSCEHKNRIGEESQGIVTYSECKDCGKRLV